MIVQFNGRLNGRFVPSRLMLSGMPLMVQVTVQDSVFLGPFSDFDDGRGAFE